MPPDRTWIEPPAPERVLRHCGWLSAADATDPRLRVHSLSSSHRLHLVTTSDGRSAVVKQVSREAAHAGRGLARELYVYRLAGWIPALRSILPRSFHIDEARELLVIESLADGRAWPPAADALDSSGVAEGLGRCIARWQRSTRAVALWPSVAAGILDLPDALAHACVDRSEASVALMRTIAADAELADALREGRMSWRASCLIHGDLRRENWIARREKRTTVFRMLDWELAGAGDPAWDLGSVAAETVLDLVRAGGRPLASGLHWPLGAFLECLRAYEANRGPVDFRDGASSERIVLFAVCRLLHVAIEWAEAQPGDSPFPGAVVDAARDMLRGRTRLARAVVGRTRS